MSRLWVQTLFRKWRSWEITNEHAFRIREGNPAGQCTESRSSVVARRGAARWIAKEGCASQHAHFLAALQLAHFALLQGAFYAQAVEQNSRRRFAGVPAFSPTMPSSSPRRMPSASVSCS